MDAYNKAAYGSSKLLTQIFSTSFSASTSLIDTQIRQDIYNIYGLVRVADEIVDTYMGSDAEVLLDNLEAEVYEAIRLQFSANIIVHAFALTAQKYAISKSLIKPFFASMRMDIADKTYSKSAYKKYIYGSAEVVGLMCLLVFVGGDKKQYVQLEKGAAALGSAFQKINFLRDIKDDFDTRGRYYFPVGSYETFDASVKNQIIQDIQRDLDIAKSYIEQLPSNSRRATLLAFLYYSRLFKQLQKASATTIKQSRIRVNNLTKLLLYIRVRLASR